MKDDTAIMEPGQADGALPEGEPSYRDIFNAGSDGLFIHDEDGRILQVNDRTCDLFGFSVQEFLHLSVSDLSLDQPPYTQAEAIQQVQKALAEGYCVFPWRSKRKNGELFWSEVALRSCTVAGKKRVIASVRDIDERKKVEDALRESEVKLSKIFHSSSNAMAFTEFVSGRIVDINTTWMQASGITREEAHGKTALELGLWADRADCEVCVAELKEVGRFRDYETTILMKSQKLTHLVSAEVIELGDKRYVLWEFRDINDRKRAEEALRQSEARLKEAQRLARLGNWELDFLIDTLTWSDEVFRIFEIDRERFAASYPAFLAAIHPEDREAVQSAYTQSLETRQPYEITHRILTPGGRIKYVQEKCETYYNPEGKPLRSVGTVQDITAQKRLEEQLRQAQKMEAIGHLAGGVAHDFNNILAAMMMNLDLLQGNQSLDQPIQEALKEFEAGAQRAAQLTRQLLMFSRRSVLEVKTLNVNDVVVNLLKMLGRLMGENIALQFLSKAADPWVKADAGMLEQVLMNLSVNARDAMPKGGRITITTEAVEIDLERAKLNPEMRSGSFICLSVADTGCGMDELTLQHIFEPFFTTKSMGQGTGLGLATVYGIVAQHRGWVEVESQVGRGSTFQIFLPASAKTAAEKVESSLEAAAQGHETILVVEDDQGVRRMVTQVLIMLGYQVLEAGNGQEAMRLWQGYERQIDLLITDMIMPEGMSGLELAERLREEKTDLKIIISSGYSTEMTEPGKTAAKGIVYLHKPYRASLLGKTVRDCLDRK